MYPPPAGPALTAEQCEEHNATFLSSDSYGYSSPQIGIMLRWAESDGDSDEHPLAAPDEEQQNAADNRGRFARLLDRPVGFIPETSPRPIATQVAIDAHAPRHHAAESLVRFTAALLQRTNVAESCVWAGLSAGANQLDQIVGRIRDSFSSAEDSLRFARLLFREQELQSGMTEQIASDSNGSADWLQFAIDLLVGHELQLNAGHNKVEHGLSERAGNDIIVSFVTTPPSADGTIPVGALTGTDAVHIFDRPVTEVLPQVPKADNHRQGLELSQWRANAPAILAEAYMIAWAHGTMFHVASSKYFEGRTDLLDYLSAPAHPGYSEGGPHRDHDSGKAPVGMKFPFTIPPCGGPMRRPPGLAFRDSFNPLIFTGSAMRNVCVVADKTTEEA